MHTRSMIRLDAVVGLPLCALAFAAGLPWRLLPRRRPAQVRHILVIKFLGLGSVLLATPLLEQLRQRYPRARISFLTFEGQAGLVARLPGVDEVLEAPRSSLFGLLLRVPGLLLRLRRRRFDVALDLEFYSRLSNLVSWGSGATQRIGFFVRQRWRGSLLTDPVYFNATRPYGEAVLALLHPLGVARPGPAAPLVGPVVRPEEERAACARLVTLGVPEHGALVVINVNASDLCDERRWPPARYAGLVNRFGAEIAHAERFVFIGGPGEEGVVAEVLGQVDEAVRPRCLDLSGRTKLVELSVLLARASVLITNDSGPMHLAASLGLPTISFFGPETPRLYGPVGERHLVFYSGYWCSPCLSVYNAKIAMCAGENECMRRIQLDEVVDRARTFCREVVGMAPPLPRPVADHLPRPALPGSDERGRGP